MSNCAQQRIEGITYGSLEVISTQFSLRFHVANMRFDSRSALEIFLQRSGHPPFLARNVNAAAFYPMPFVAFINERLLNQNLRKFFCLFEATAQSVTIVLVLMQSLEDKASPCL